MIYEQLMARLPTLRVDRVWPSDAEALRAGLRWAEENGTSTQNRAYHKAMTHLLFRDDTALDN